ncbi:GNAT family N-acetyltransferase [Pseudarthrobacter sp. J1738]|uniref:GNAT family N-acetyltransferase n=1 Tax=Pseudarthrobacter sp. J1738 TaxID=3420446 RepID=UPI003D2BB369
MATEQQKYTIHRLPTPAKDSPKYGRAKNWYQAVSFGFHESRVTEELVDASLATLLVDQMVLTGVYQNGEPAAHSLPADVPVATFATFRKSINVGFGQLQDALLITDVTVRPTHRRRGLLRGMMLAELERAKDDGLAVAALTASEGSIYGRFGFGVTSYERRLKIDTSARFKLRHEATGSVEIVEPKVLLELAPSIFARVHRATPGSVDRQEIYRLRIAGEHGSDGKVDHSIRAAVHYGADGSPDGYVSYKFMGWETEPATMEIVDIVAATDAAYLELWQFLASIDLVERIVWNQAPIDDPLAWALTDPRCIKSAGYLDLLWLRILDTQAALSARRYAVDDRLVIKVEDPLEFASGLYLLDVNGSVPTVELITEADAENGGVVADLELDASALASIYLGGVNPVSLLAAGRLVERTAGAAMRASLLFAVERPVHCLTHF